MVVCDVKCISCLYKIHSISVYVLDNQQSMSLTWTGKSTRKFVAIAFICEPHQVELCNVEY